MPRILKHLALLMVVVLVAFPLRAEAQSSMSYADTVLDDNPFVYYGLDELSVTDTAQDEIGIHNGTFQNNPTVGIEGAVVSDPANTAICFDRNQSQYVELTTLGDYGSRTTEGFTVEYWLRTSDSANNQCVLGTANSPGYITDFLVDIAYEGNIGRLRLYFRDDYWCRYNVGFYPDGTNVNIYDNQWHHIVHVYNPAESAQEDRMIFYIDGKRQEVEVWLGGCVPYDSSDFNHPMTLGAINLRGNVMSYLNGCLDEVAFYTRPLSKRRSRVIIEQQPPKGLRPESQPAPMMRKRE